MVGKGVKTKRRIKGRKATVVKEPEENKQAIEAVGSSDAGKEPQAPCRSKVKQLKLKKKQTSAAGKQSRTKKRRRPSLSTSSAVSGRNAKLKSGALRRAHPQILCIGTPGVGKTTFSRRLAELTGMHHIEVSQLVKDKKLYTEWDDELDGSIFDEDMVVEELERQLSACAKGAVLDFHSCECFPEEWFDLVLVLRCVNDVLYPRLESRGYPARKITENIEAEIFEVVVEEAREAFDEDKVWQRPSETNDNMEENLKEVQRFVENWRTPH